ncbi:uncharacterized protein LOC135401776 [Ornithodoros turicata]|uniref:uncharacterized protein LOC135401776 n=1 Tax=Ornithodoros turicata TaxID=34597 RepID=UPI00313A0A67
MANGSLVHDKSPLPPAQRDTTCHSDSITVDVSQGDDSSKELPPYMRSAPVKPLTHPVDRNIAGCFIASVAFVSIAVVTGLPLVIVLAALLPLSILLRHVCTSCASAQQGVLCEDDKRFVSPMDTFWLHDSEFNFHVAHCVFFLDPGLSATHLGRLIVERVLDKTNDEGKRIFRRFTRKIIPVVGGFTWVEDDTFRIERHVIEDTRHVKNVQQLNGYIMGIMSKGMNVDKPLWDIHLLPNYDQGKETVLIARVHQVISDGVSLMKLFCNHLCDPGGPRLRLKPRFGGAGFPLNVFRAVLVGPLTFLFSWLLLTRKDFNLLQRGPPAGRQRVIAWSGAIRRAQVHRIKQVTRCSFNDVLMAAASGAVRTFFQKKGVRNPPDIKVCIAVDLRYEPPSGEVTPELGTQLSTATVRLPTNTEGAIPRLWEVHQVMEDLKTSADPVVMYGAARFLLTLLPYRMAHWFLGRWHSKPSLLFCNVPGPEEAMLLGLSRVRSAVVWAGWTPEVPVAVTVTSYAGAFHIAVSSEKDIVSDPEEIIRGFAKQLNHMSNLLSKRRIPGEHRRKTSYTAERRQREIIKPPIHELHHKLHQVQDELHLVGQKLLAEEARVDPSAEPGTSAKVEALRRRLLELQEEFSELLLELRRRKSIAEGLPCDIQDEEEDLDLDGEVRRPRRRALSATVRRPSLQSFVSTTRPLTTGNSPLRAGEPHTSNATVTALQDQHVALLVQSDTA